jgi:hypothetical protein
MDLNRWGLHKINRLTARYRNFQEFLSEALEGARNTEKVEPAFQVSDEIESVLQKRALTRGLFSRKIKPKVPDLFENLAPYFEAGFLIKTSATFEMQKMFIFNRLFIPPSGQATPFELALPQVQVGQVIKGQVRPVLKLLHLEALRALDEASVFVMRPSEDYIFLFICNRPHPWQVGFLERARSVIMRVLELEIT